MDCFLLSEKITRYQFCSRYVSIQNTKNGRIAVKKLLKQIHGNLDEDQKKIFYLENIEKIESQDQ